MSQPRSLILLLILLSSLAWAAGCGDDTIEPLEPPRATTITVAPAAVTLVALANTVQLSAEVRDQNGAAMAGATVAWQSAAVGVATVDATGLVTATGNGTATITATAGGASGSAAVTVAQEVTRIEVSPTGVKVSAGDTIRVTAEAWDANGFAVPDGEFAWASSDTAVATVDASGLVSGIVEGVVSITATRDGAHGEVLMTVAHEDWGDLVSFYNATDGQGWIANDGWLSDLPIGQWHGVTTDETGHVTVLKLSASDLAGPIPPELANLSHLETLDLERNSLEGSIPPELGKLRNLKSLILGVNDLTGSIPAEIGDLTNLEVLRLRRNDLTGTVPPELGKLRNLTRLGLDSNAFAGPIPSDLTGLAGLRAFHFSGNESLCTPGSADFAAWLARLDVYVGPLCNEADRRTLGSLHGATGGEGWHRSTGWLGDGPLEDWHGVETDSLGRVAALDLSDNGLVGGVPAVLTQLASMTTLRMGGNEGLTGQLPLSLSALPLSELRYADTGVCVPPDESFGEWLTAIASHEGTGQACAPLSDRAILEAFYHATGGHQWENSENWLSDTPLGDWRGVSTDDDGRVVGLDLSWSYLKGSIPPELGGLTNLSKLDLSWNGLTGLIPPELGSLPGLQLLYLEYNRLTGPIPSELGNLSTLAELRLDGNALTGPVPSELGNLSTLAELRLDGNALTGPIPSELGNLSTLAQLRLNNNRLTGPIPSELANLSTLAELRLNNNRLTGPIPSELGTLPGMSILRLSSNRLTGPIPTELGNLATLVELQLADNELTGPIPPTLGKLSLLDDLILHGNELAGPIPPELGTALSLSSLTLRDNRLTGPIPPALGNLLSLETLSLNNNELTGPIPAELGGLSNLRTLHLHGNELAGPIPGELGQPSDLRTLSLDWNELTGAVPPELGGLSRLGLLSAMGNQLTGPLPTELGGMTRLRRLHLTGNTELSGALPSGLTDLATLNELLLGGTGLCAPADTAFQDWISRVTVARVRPCGPAAVSSAYLTQVVQSRELPVPLVAGREALLRVFPTASRPTDEGIPPVRATFYADGVEIYVVEIPGSSVPIPTEVRDAESALEKSANAVMPGSVIQPGLEMVIEIDPDSTLDPELGVTTRIPEAGRATVQVRQLPALDLTFVPFQWMRDRDSLIVDLARAMAADPESHEMLADTRTMLPVGELGVKAHEPVLTSTNNPVSLAIQTWVIRDIEGADGYYMGIMPERIVGGQSGVAYYGGKAAFSAADGFVIAHELGHNFFLGHAPCGGAGGPDRAFPQSNASIGGWGYDFRGGGALIPPHVRDLMSYCGPPRWVSGYSFARALGHRLAHESGTNGSADAPVSSLLLWGGVDAQGEPFLEPAFVVGAPPSVPQPDGDYEVVGRTARGNELFAVKFDMMEMADTDGQSSFVLALPLRDEWAGAVESITLSGPAGSTAMDLLTDRPMAIVRDPQSRQVRAILRGEDATDLVGVAADAVGQPGPPLQVIFSRGIPDAEAWRR